MQLSVSFVNVQKARLRLAKTQKQIEPIIRGALNTTATKTRAERYVKELSASISGGRVRRGMKVKRANRARLNSRILPSSSGVLVVNYRRWGIDAIDATRARIWVLGPNGRKIAAGFVNPSSRNKLPLMTKSSRTRQAPGKKPAAYNYKRDLQLAQGPSLAYWFKQLTGNKTISWVNSFLQQEFERRVQRELAKG